MSKIRQVNHMLLTYTTLHADICNIIANYSVECIMQIWIDDKVQYKYNNELYSVNCGDDALGIVNGIVCKFTIFTVNHMQSLFVSTISYNWLVNCKIHMPDNYRIYNIKYSNGLVCEYSNKIVIYDVVIGNTTILTERCNLRTPNTLLYADQYIYLRDKYDECIVIYDTNLVKLTSIKTNDYVRYVALVDNVLSYYSNSWHAIVDVNLKDLSY